MTTTRPRFQQGKCIPDPVVQRFLENLQIYPDASNHLLQDEFCDTYWRWIQASPSTLRGVEDFTCRAYSQGTTEAFDKFYIRHAHRRFRIWKGEYAYHKIMFKSGLRWAWLDDDEIRPFDAVIVSVPFADSGDVYRYAETVEQCEKLGVPVLVDLCWFGTVLSIDINLQYECIREITFSLSKTFPISRHRIGMRLSRETYEEDGLLAYRRDNYLNYYSQRVGIEVMRYFSASYIPNRYQKAQERLCKEIQATPSLSVCLATGGDNWSHLNRGGPHNRLCLSGELVEYRQAD